jgi:L-ascorbate metabolism protein UlaG (beta-lactamase superfamily)
MKLQLIRNATMRITYGSARFVTDPLLAVKLSMRSYSGKSPNPLVDLPMPSEQVLDGADFVLLSHTHSDHFDPTAQQMVPKDTRFYCQPVDEKRLEELGFSRVTPVEREQMVGDIRIMRTPGSHGRGPVLKEMGTVSGFLLASPGEPTVYWIGDSVFYDEVRQVIDRHGPDVIITHSSGAVWGSQRDLIVMDAAQTVDVCKYAPKATVIAVHMDALDHGTVTRADLSKARAGAGIPASRLLIPEDGETITIGNADQSRHIRT